MIILNNIGFEELLVTQITTESPIIEILKCPHKDKKN